MSTSSDAADSRAAELRVWLNEHGPALRAYFGKRAAPADVDDLVQDVFLRLQMRASSAPVENVQGYLFRVAANVLIDRRRAEASRGWDRYGPLDEAPDLKEERSPERTLIAKQDYSQLVAAIGRLPPRMRAAFMFHRFEQMTYPAIARRMGNSPDAVKQLIRKAFERLAEERRT
ncbi:MAG TPA: sigma-70 family RNA polymerase sigma factor [Caulobacteraceae bacterium]|nr:sigma-70 family RNA polymerase sigma factor [Caulobacteraceae bacterium]